MSQPLEHRIAALEASVEHLNGAYEQIDKRLGDFRADMVAGFAGVDHRFDAMERRSDLRFEVIEDRFEALEVKFEKYDKLDSKMDASVRVLVTWMIGNTGIVLGAIAAVAFLRH